MVSDSDTHTHTHWENGTQMFSDWIQQQALFFRVQYSHNGVEFIH